MPPGRRRPRRAGALADLSPLRILMQIVLLQAGFYGAGTVLILFTSLVAGERFSAELVLGWARLRGDTAEGWTLGLCWLVDSLVGVILLLLLVARSKLVPDFALTLHGIHFVVTSLYSHALPANLLWWALQAASSAIMISLGIWTCQWRELRPMSFGAAAASMVGAGGAEGKAKKTPMLPHEIGGEGDEEGEERGGGGGLLRFLGGARRDGRGEYEMVGMAERGEG